MDINGERITMGKSDDTKSVARWIKIQDKKNTRRSTIWKALVKDFPMVGRWLE